MFLVTAFAELILTLVLILGLATLAQQVREQRATNAAATEDTAADQQPHEAPLTVAAFAKLVLGLALVLFLLCPGSLTQQVREQHATGAPATQEAAADQQPHEAVVPVTALGKLVLALVFIPLFLRFAAGAQQVCEQHATQASAAQEAAADQQAHEPALLAGALLAGCLFALILLFLRLLRFATLAQQMREQEVAQATATQQATADQQAHDAPFLVGILLAPTLLSVVLLAGLNTLAQQVRDQQVAQTATTQEATANQQAHDAPPLLFASASAFFTLEVLVLRRVSVTDEAGKQCAAQSPATQRAATRGKPRKFLGFAHKSS